MATKITKTQFESWKKKFVDRLTIFMNSSFAKDKMSAKQLSDFPTFIAQVEFGLGKENPFAVMLFILIYEDLPGHDSIKNEVHDYTEGLTLQQWLDGLKAKLKEHAEAGGYYKSSEPVDKSALRQSWKKAWELIKDSKRYTELRPYLSEETKNLILTTKIIMDKFAEESKEDIYDIKENAVLLNEYPFLVKDLAGRIEKGQSDLAKKEQQDKNDQGNQDGQDNGNQNDNGGSNGPSSNLTEEKIKKLEREKKELEQELANNQLSDSEKKQKEQEVENSKKAIEDKENEINKLKGGENNKENKNPKDSNKLNWAIGLGITAVVITLFCMILLLRAQKKK